MSVPANGRLIASQGGVMEKLRGKVAASDSFVLPVESTRRYLEKRGRDEGKVTKRDQNASDCRTNSLLEDIGLAVESAGSAGCKMFAARPAKRARDVVLLTPGSGSLAADRRSATSDASTGERMDPDTTADCARVLSRSFTRSVSAPGSGRTSRSSVCRFHPEVFTSLVGYKRPTCSSLRKRSSWDSAASDAMDKSSLPLQSIDGEPVNSPENPDENVPANSLKVKRKDVMDVLLDDDYDSLVSLQSDDESMDEAVISNDPDLEDEGETESELSAEEAYTADDVSCDVTISTGRQSSSNLIGPKQFGKTSLSDDDGDPMSSSHGSADGDVFRQTNSPRLARKLSMQDTGSMLAGLESGEDDVFFAQGDLPATSESFGNFANTKRRGLLRSSLCSWDTPHKDVRGFRYPLSSSEVHMEMVDVSSASSQYSMSPVQKRPKVAILRPRKIIVPEAPVGDEAGLRRSTRNRMKPVRQWLGEKALYERSPTTGCSRLLGTNEVSVADRGMIQARHADPRVVLDFELRHKAFLRRTREDRNYRRRFQSESDSHVFE